MWFIFIKRILFVTTKIRDFKLELRKFLIFLGNKQTLASKIIILRFYRLLVLKFRFFVYWKVLELFCFANQISIFLLAATSVQIIIITITHVEIVITIGIVYIGINLIVVIMIIIINEYMVVGIIAVGAIVIFCGSIIIAIRIAIVKFIYIIKLKNLLSFLIIVVLLFL